MLSYVHKGNLVVSQTESQILALFQLRLLGRQGH